MKKKPICKKYKEGDKTKEENKNNSIKTNFMIFT